MQVIDLAWLAGVVDGEGCFSIFNRTNKSRNGKMIITPTASVTITNSNLALINECVCILKKLGVKYVLKNPRNSKTRNLERVDIRNYQSIKLLVKAILPYLIGKKEQAELIIRFVEKASNRSGFRATNERKTFFEQMSNLNKFGQVIRRDYTPNSDKIGEDIVRHFK